MPFDLPEGDPCLFCERVAGRLDDWVVIDADDETISFVNPRQFEEGQACVIPKRHAPTILDLTEQEASSLMRSVHRLAKAMTDAFNPDGLTLYQNNGVASFQEIPHVHMHVVPRRYDGGWGEGPPHLASLDKGEREEQWRRRAAPLERQKEVAERIRLHLRA